MRSKPAPTVLPGSVCWSSARVERESWCARGGKCLTCTNRRKVSNMHSVHVTWFTCSWFVLILCKIDHDGPTDASSHFVSWIWGPSAFHLFFWFLCFLFPCVDQVTNCVFLGSWGLWRTWFQACDLLHAWATNRSGWFRLASWVAARFEVAKGHCPTRETVFLEPVLILKMLFLAAQMTFKAAEFMWWIRQRPNLPFRTTVLRSNAQEIPSKITDFYPFTFCNELL